MQVLLSFFECLSANSQWSNNLFCAKLVAFLGQIKADGSLQLIVFDWVTAHFSLEEPLDYY